MLAPELFDSDDLGYGLVRGEGIVPNELLDKAKLAVANCPEFAILIKRTELPST
jgi:ferredoxin